MGLFATVRSIVEVEEYTPEAAKAIEALAIIDDPSPFWPYILLAKTRYAELIGRPVESLACIEAAELLHSPEEGSFAYDVLVARRIEALIVATQVSSARAVYEQRAMDAPHCRVAYMGLLCGERNFAAIDQELASLLTAPNLTAAQRAQAETFSALGGLVRDGAIPEYIAPGLGQALSLRAHRRVVLMFPPLIRDALEPYLSADLLEDWRRYQIRIRLWDREHVEVIGSLTQREMAMLRNLDLGRSYAEIAALEHLSVNTVKSHMKTLYKKLGVSTSSDALHVGRRWGLLGP